MKPRKGRTAINALIHQLYDVQSSMAHSDFADAAQLIRSSRYKLSLVVLVTNIQGEDQDDLVAAVKLLQRQHLVLVASIREQVLDESISSDVENLDDALRYSGSLEFDNFRKIQM